MRKSCIDISSLVKIGIAVPSFQYLLADGNHPDIYTIAMQTISRTGLSNWIRDIPLGKGAVCLALLFTHYDRMPEPEKIAFDRLTLY